MSNQRPTNYLRRHISSSDNNVHEILHVLELDGLAQISDFAIPEEIKSNHDFSTLGAGMSEQEMLTQLKAMMKKNKVYRSFIGMGYHNTFTPPVIQRCFFENPAWYTAYTPYQAEISQGRLEALLNFQTMVADLTGMEIANSSLLDEGTAVAEAVAMAAASRKEGVDAFLVSPLMHPQTLNVVKTRAEALGLEMHVGDPNTFEKAEKVFALVLQYPDTFGTVHDYRNLVETYKADGVKIIVAADLLALTLLAPPGEWGADIVVGSTQRFGVPMGFGGPHAAYLATKETYKRLMPGRLVGSSVDSQGRYALRLALQTREQHIRREKATSNICTAQVLLANMASFYAVYHGPHGLQAMAERIHHLAKTLAATLRELSFDVLDGVIFDTVVIRSLNAHVVLEQAELAGMNWRMIDKQTVGISLDEISTEEDLRDILKVLTGRKKDLTSVLPGGSFGELRRRSRFLEHSVFNSYNTEVEFTRYIHRLQAKDITLTHAMIPLGSCTMKLNAAATLVPVSWPEVNSLHPFAPLNQSVGFREMIDELEFFLSEISGFAKVSIQPNSGSQGEFASLLAIRKYHEAKGEGERRICLIPSSAHGTNPASAALAGLEVVVVACDASGSIEISDLIEKAEQHSKRLSCIMLTFPSTYGVYEIGVKEIARIVHEHGGQVYLDGANMNALVGVCRIAELGADACHMNLHKTFAIPHGGGGPGVGPIGVAQHLVKYVPSHPLAEREGTDFVGPISAAPWGSASILPISWAYIKMMGAEGLKKATYVSVLNANYITEELSSHYPILYRGGNGAVAHECIIDLRPLKAETGIDVTDVAKRLIDFGFHPPTMSFPVAGTLMIEPTESESKEEMDRFIAAMIQIRKEIQDVETGRYPKDNNVLKNSPHPAEDLLADEWTHPYSRQEAAYPLAWLKKNKYWPPVSRIDNSFGDRNLICSCPPIEAYR